MISHVNLALVYSVDQMLDFYELSEGAVMPDKMTVKQETYEALLAYENDGKAIPYMRLTHYRGVALNVIK